MGNLVGTCLNHDDDDQANRTTARKTTVKRPASNHTSPVNSSTRFSRSRSSRRHSGSSSGDIKMDDPVLREQAMAAAAMILQQHRNGGGGSLPFDRSTSVRHPMRNNSRNCTSGKNQVNVPRSASTRPRSSTDLLLQPHQLVNQDNNRLEGVETNHFVLVHGGGYGAWCWYKTIALLDEAGFRVTAIDLTGSGIHSFDPNRIQSLSQYVKPLTDFLEKLADGEKVILVGHDVGGTCISHAMELHAPKVSKAIFVAAAMLNSGQSTLDMISMQVEADDLMKQGQIFLYGNGNEHPPTAINLDKSLLKDLLFNQSPQKDIALASVSMRPIPFAPMLEHLSLTDQHYGSVSRYYIQTTDDNAIPIELQEKMVNQSQAAPKQVFRLKGSDHAPFFSKPQALHKLLVEILKISS